MRDAWRHCTAEFIGIFALVFVGGASIMSGHLNPAVTLGFLAARRIEPMMAMLYIVAQLLGALVAAYALKAIFPTEVATATRLGGQALALDVTFTKGVFAEAIATFF